MHKTAKQIQPPGLDQRAKREVAAGRQRGRTQSVGGGWSSVVVLLSLVFIVSVQQKVPAVERGIYIEFSGSFGTVTREGRVSLKSPLHCPTPSTLRRQLT